MIIQDTKIRNKFHLGYERYFHPNEIVLHGTGGSGTYQYVLDGHREAQYLNGVGLFHYLIELSGRTIEIISPDRWVYHSSSGRHDRKTIGIELLNPDGNNELSYNELQYLALYDLIIELTDRYKIKYITSHKRNAFEYSKKNKECPGNFDWIKLEDWLFDAGFDFENIDEQFYKLEGKNEEDKIIP